MTRKFTFILAALGALTASAQAQTAAKPTKADIQKVVQIISGDKAKTATYCKLAALDEEMAKASDAHDDKKLEDLGKQADGLQKSLGPEYAKLSEGLDQVDPQSKDGEALFAEFEPLDKLCK